MKDRAVVVEETSVEENPKKFKELADRFKRTLSNPKTMIDLLKGLGAVPAAVSTVVSALSGNIPVAIGASLVTAGIVLGGLMDKSYKNDVAPVMGG